MCTFPLLYDDVILHYSVISGNFTIIPSLCSRVHAIMSIYKYMYFESSASKRRKAVEDDFLTDSSDSDETKRHWWTVAAVTVEHQATNKKQSMLFNASWSAYLSKKVWAGLNCFILIFLQNIDKLMII